MYIKTVLTSVPFPKVLPFYQHNNKKMNGNVPCQVRAHNALHLGSERSCAELKLYVIIFYHCLFVYEMTLPVPSVVLMNRQHLK